MKGTVKIEALPGTGVSVSGDIKEVSRLDILAMFDALAGGFSIDEDDRKTLGIMFAMGGLNAIPGVKTATMEVNRELFEILKKLKENGNETDSR